MRGGAEETINVGITTLQGDVLVNAVSLKFSDKSDKLFMSIDIEKYKGDVRKLLDVLFRIDGFNRDETHNQKFLMGLADYPGREKTKSFAVNKVKHCDEQDYDKFITEIESLSEQTFSKIKFCNLEIELKPENGGITFTVKKYHRMKIGETSCKKTTITTSEHRVLDMDDGEWNGDVETVRNTDKQKVGLVYPKIEFAESNPKGFIGIGEGIDYIDYEKPYVYRNQKNNLFTFTVKDKTIEDLKTALKEIKIRLLANEEPTTDAIEAEKKVQAEEAARKAAEEAEKEAKAKAERDAAAVKEEEDYKESVVKQENLEDLITTIKPLMEWAYKWVKENPQYSSVTTYDERENRVKVIKQAFLDHFNENDQKAIADALETYRTKYYKLKWKIRIPRRMRVLENYYDDRNFEAFINTNPKDERGGTEPIDALLDKVFNIPADYKPYFNDVPD